MADLSRPPQAGRSRCLGRIVRQCFVHGAAVRNYGVTVVINRSGQAEACPLIRKNPEFFLSIFHGLPDGGQFLSIRIRSFGQKKRGRTLVGRECRRIRLCSPSGSAGIRREYSRHRGPSAEVLPWPDRRLQCRRCDLPGRKSGGLPCFGGRGCVLEDGFPGEESGSPPCLVFPESDPSAGKRGSGSGKYGRDHTGLSP